MKKLQLVAAAMAMCGLVGTAYAVTPTPPPSRTCSLQVLTSELGNSACTGVYNVAIYPNALTSAAPLTSTNCTINSGKVQCNNGTDTFSFPCGNMSYFAVQVQCKSQIMPVYAPVKPGLVGTDCTGGENCAGGAGSHKWIYWSDCLSQAGLSTTFQLGGQSGSSPNLNTNDNPNCPTGTPTL